MSPENLDHKDKKEDDKISPSIFAKNLEKKENKKETIETNEAQQKWNKTSQDVEKITDAIDNPIDEKIKGMVTALNIFEINTSGSCEGHQDDWGAGAPWVQIEAPNEPKEVYNGQKEILEKVAKENNITVDDFRKDKKFRKLYMEAMTKCAENGETKEIIAWEEENKKLRMVVEDIVSDFYNSRTIPENMKIRCGDIGVRGSFRIISGTEEDYDKDFEKTNDREKEELGKRLEEYRKEITAFSEFLKGKFFAEGESYVNNIRKKIQEDGDQKNIEKIRKMIAGQGLPEDIKATNKQEKKSDGMKEEVLALAEKMKIPVISEDNIDEILGDKPYLSHAIVVKPERLLEVLSSGELQSSEKSGKAAMTYEIDKLIGMDKNVFLALGKGYMRKDRYALIFDQEKISQLAEASFIEGDLMDLGHDAVIDFLDKHKPEIFEAIESKREVIKKKFQEKVEYAFEGGHGIYEKYFSNPPADIVDDFLKAIETKGFKGIELEKEVIDQFTIPSDVILSAEIMPPELRKELINILQESVINKHTIAGSENIQQAINKSWQNNKENYSTFLTGERMTPEKVTEIRIPNQIKLKEAIIAIFAPK